MLKPLTKDKYILRQIYKESLSSNSLTKIPKIPTHIIFKQNFSGTESSKQKNGTPMRLASGEDIVNSQSPRMKVSGVSAVKQTRNVSRFLSFGPRNHGSGTASSVVSRKKVPHVTIPTIDSVRSGSTNRTIKDTL